MKTIRFMLAAAISIAMLAAISSCKQESGAATENAIGGGVEVSRAKSYTNISDMATDSQIIVIGNVKRVLEALEDPDEHLYMTTFAFQTETAFKGNVNGEIIVCQHGTADTPWFVVKDDPLFKIGETYLLFLNKNLFGTYYYYGPCARYKIENGKVFSMNYILQNNNVYKASEALDFNGAELTAVTTTITETLDTVRFISDAAIGLLSGETGRIEVVLATGKYGEGKVSYQISRVDSKDGSNQIPMPEGMEVTIEPIEFITAPYNDYKSVIEIRTDEQVISPGEYWILVAYDIGGTISGQRVINVNIDKEKLSEIKTRPQ